MLTKTFQVLSDLIDDRRTFSQIRVMIAIEYLSGSDHSRTALDVLTEQIGASTTITNEQYLATFSHVNSSSLAALGLGAIQLMKA